MTTRSDLDKMYAEAAKTHGEEFSMMLQTHFKGLGMVGILDRIEEVLEASGEEELLEIIPMLRDNVGELMSMIVSLLMFKAVAIRQPPNPKPFILAQLEELNVWTAGFETQLYGEPLGGPNYGAQFYKSH